MFKRFLATTLSLVLIALLLSPVVMAEPYQEFKIGDGTTVIEAVWFDSGADNYYDTDPDGGNHDIRADEEVQTYDYTINGDYQGGRETDTPSCIGWINAEEWVQYTVQAEVAGNYQLDIWGAGTGGEFVAYCNGVEMGSVYVEDEDGSWHNYTLLPVGLFNMTEGTNIIKTEFPDGGINVESLVITLVEAGGAPPPPVWKPKNFKVTDSKTVITAVDFDAGEANYGKAGATADGSTDIRANEAVNTEIGESEFGGNVGWIGAGDWVQYTVTVEQDGKYKFAAWMASDADAPGTVAIYVDDQSVGESPNSNKGGWQAYELYDVGEIEMTSGRHIIKAEFPSGNMNFSALEVTRTGDMEVATEAPTEEEAAPPADENSADDNAGDADGEATTTKAAAVDSEDENGNSNTVIFIIVGAVIVVALVVIIVFATKKKK